MPAAFRLENLSLSFSAGRPVLKKITWQVRQGEWWGISGSNGSGKTTLLYVLAGIIPRLLPARVDGKIQINQTGGLVFQNPDFSLFNPTVAEEAGFGHKNGVRAALKTVGLWSQKNADPQTMSYGQKQKLCLAAVLARNPELILLDEPASMLDYKSSLNLYSILSRLRAQGKTIIVVEHDSDLLARYTQKTLIVDRGAVAASGPSKTVFKNRALINRLGLKPAS